jgi:predicted DCC family thiol-disulfide oxidoreductase YuxK
MEQKPTVFYDGNCIICDLEISTYKKQEKLGLINFIDIQSDEFKKYSNLLSFDDANLKMHVLKNGKLINGVDSFLEIWAILPQKRYKVLAKIISHKYVRPLADIGYNIFAKYRKYLPKYKR